MPRPQLELMRRMSKLYGRNRFILGNSSLNLVAAPGETVLEVVCSA